jgi:hypothetical protein
MCCGFPPVKWAQLRVRLPDGSCWLVHRRKHPCRRADGRIWLLGSCRLVRSSWCVLLLFLFDCGCLSMRLSFLAAVDGGAGLHAILLPWSLHLLRHQEMVGKPAFTILASAYMHKWTHEDVCNSCGRWLLWWIANLSAMPAYTAQAAAVRRAA